VSIILVSCNKPIVICPSPAPRRYNPAVGFLDSEVVGVTIDELMREALALDPSSRAHIAHELLNSLDELSEAEVDELWLAEAARRDAALDAGAPSSPAAEVIARARARRG
jgi:hypothetical protein